MPSSAHAEAPETGSRVSGRQREEAVYPMGRLLSNRDASADASTAPVRDRNWAEPLASGHESQAFPEEKAKKRLRLITLCPDFAWCDALRRKLPQRLTAVTRTRLSAVARRRCRQRDVCGTRRKAVRLRHANGEERHPARVAPLCRPAREGTVTPTATTVTVRDRMCIYLTVTLAPAASRASLAFSAASLATFSRMALGALSTRSLASLRPRLVSERTSLMT